MWKCSQNQKLVQLALIAMLFSSSLGEQELTQGRSISSQQIKRTSVSSSWGKMKVWAEKKFTRFKPVERKDEFRYLEAVSDKTTMEEIYSPEKIRELQARYNDGVAVSEAKINNPYRRAREQEIQQYHNQNQELANWTAKQALNQKLYDMLGGADKNSAPLKVMSAVQSVTSFGEEEKTTATTTAAKTKSAPLAENTVLEAKKEESIPTKLKAKMNMIYGRGQLLFSNPIVTTALHVNVRQKPANANELSTADRVVVDMNKDFKALSMKSNVKYGVERKVVEFSVAKKITDEISCNLNSQRFTGDQRAASGIKSVESVNMMYTVQF